MRASATRRLWRRRFCHEGKSAARQAVLAVFVEGDDLHRDMACEGILLELTEHRPTKHVGQKHIQRDRGQAGIARPVAARPMPRIATSALKPRSRAKSTMMRA